MLARSFLTPEELNISDKQFNALVQVLGTLERGELLWHNNKDVAFTSDVGFNMAKWSSRLEGNCGSVGCIGYWCQKFGGDVTRDNIELCAFRKRNKNLRQLFFPTGLPVGRTKTYNDITVDEGIQALSNYLTTGKADWASVLA